VVCQLREVAEAHPAAQRRAVLVLTPYRVAIVDQVAPERRRRLMRV